MPRMRNSSPTLLLREMPNPTPPEIRQARELAGLSQTAAAALISSTLRTWQDWEAGKARMHPGLWELFRIKSAS